MTNWVFFGEAMQELNPAQQLRFGGDTYNSAVYFKRLCGTQCEVQYATAVGSDALSAAALQQWQAEGLGVTYLAIDSKRTLGRYGITLSEGGERTFHYDRSNSAARAYFQTPLAAKLQAAIANREVDNLYFSGISLAILSPADRAQLLTLAVLQKRLGGRVIFDSNYRAKLWQAALNNEDDNAAESNVESTLESAAQVAAKWYHTLYQLADVLLITNDDHSAVFGDSDEAAMVAFYRSYPQAEVVIKQGTQDTLVLTAAQLQRFAVAAISKPVDTTAAGDAFAAGYLAARNQGQSIATAVTIAQQLAGQVIMAPGAIVETSVALEEYSHV
ncbi:sugar kinase [Pseudoalteromonas fenneropenaei]|uniref:Sugar kinase n=1 Tax=Pseudoalteromonas fenneropenaei TaxID=1737459 RepID=A0ABV7CJE7_9GAMM